VPSNEYIKNILWTSELSWIF